MQSKKVFWQTPWGYKESFSIASGLLIIGFVLEFFTKKQGLQMPSYPINLIVLLVFVAYIVITYYIYRKSNIIRWFSSVPAAIASMSVYTLLVLMMGFIPQGNYNSTMSLFGLTYLQKSLPFALCTMFVLTSLGYTMLRRISMGFTLRNIAFYLNHLGLFVILTTASLGTGDMIRLRMPVNIGESTNRAIYDEHNFAKLDFEVELIDFTIQEYPPELLLFDRETNFPVTDKGGKYPFIEKSKEGKIKDYSFTIIDYIENALPIQGGFIKSDKFGTTQAALIQIENKEKGVFVEDWISNGNFMFLPVYLDVSDKYVFGMSKPKVQKYSSVVNIYKDDKLMFEKKSIEVNMPFKYDAWKIYQYSYDSEFGRWSKHSVFELVRDPWLPVVYIGIFMMLLGSVYLLWAGRSIHTVSGKNNVELNKN